MEFLPLVFIAKFFGLVFRLTLYEDGYKWECRISLALCLGLFTTFFYLVTSKF